jgi:hypothetical protein
MKGVEEVDKRCVLLSAVLCVVIESPHSGEWVRTAVLSSMKMKETMLDACIHLKARIRA